MLFWSSNHIKNFTVIPQVFCEILWFKESCILRFLDHNLITRFLQTCCFAKKYKKNIGTSCWNKKAYLNGYDFCQNPKNLIVGTFKPSKPSPLNLFAKIEIRHFSYFMMWNFMEKKKKLMIQRSCIPGKWEKEWSQINRTLLLRWVPNLFFITETI